MDLRIFIGCLEVSLPNASLANTRWKELYVIPAVARNPAREQNPMHLEVVEEKLNDTFH